MFGKFFIYVILVIVALQLVTCRPSSRDSPREMCRLPEEKGRCRALIPRWRYDSISGRCKIFNFGGCEGNDNNFLSEKSCIERCEGI